MLDDDGVAHVNDHLEVGNLSGDRKVGNVPGARGLVELFPD